MTTKFTPGPWRTFPRLTGIGALNAYEVWDKDDNVPGSLRGDGAPAVAAANAQLIAAAPEMYEALKQAEEWLFGWKSAVPQLAVIQAALARAEGEK